MKFTLSFFLSLAFSFSASAAVPADLTPENIEKNMRLVADWQVANPKKHDSRDWTYAAFYAGMAAYGNMNPDGPGFKAIRTVGEDKKWTHFRGPYHADNQAIGQAHIEIAVFDKNPEAVKNTITLMNQVIDHDSQVSLDFGSPKNQERWSWADALFMAPTVFVKLAGYTGDEKYLNFADREYKLTYDFLYDKKESLWFRDSRYFDSKVKTANGKKMFWSRGNGWVFAGLPIILRDLPKDWKTRKFYEDTFKQMAVSMKKSQQPDGSWYPSLHDPADPAIKEMSATNFINYGLIWGINNGYLSEKEYFPVVKKAWEAACNAISEEGALGWVQPIADKPGNYTEKSTEVYASGAFLLTGSELYKYAVKKAHKNIKLVTVANNSRTYRPSETVSISWKNSKYNPEKLRIFDVRNGRVVNHQLADEDSDGTPDVLLFQADIFAGATREFWVFESDTLPAAKNEQVCYSRAVPERMDDFAWENDVAAFRMYGPTVSKPAPKGEGLISGGIDVWSKKVRTPILDKFYKAGNYHEDHGEGMDWYKVGAGPGCGGHAYVLNGKLFSTKNWVTAKNLYNGPVRTAFQVTYAPVDFGNGAQISETRTVTLDAGSSVFCSVSNYKVKGDTTGIMTAIGMDTSKNLNKSRDVSNKLVTIGKTTAANAKFWTTDDKNGSTGTAILSAGDNISITMNEGDQYLITPIVKDLPFISYAGSAWSKAGIFTNAQLWFQYCDDYLNRINVPVKVTVSDIK